MVSVDRLVDWETGELDDAGVIQLFADLVKDGTAWELQGIYGRTAHNLIENGVITASGEITQKGKELMK